MESLDGTDGIGGDLGKTEFEIGGTRFFLSKLPAMAAFDLLEAIRHELGKLADLNLPAWKPREGQTQSEPVPEGDAEEGPMEDGQSYAMVVSLLKIVLSLDPVFVRKVRTALFERVSFSNNRVPSPQQLAGAEEIAFDGLEPIAVYEVLVRAVAVNFTPSLRALVSRFPDVNLDSSLSALSE